MTDRMLRLLALAVLAGACSVASAYATSTGRHPAGDARRVASARAVEAAVTKPRGTHRACRRALAVRAKLERPLAMMVAPTQTVRLASPLKQTPSLHAGGYVFPFAQAIAVADTFGAPRPGVSWHHGDDLFAPRGTPVVAVANGVVFSVGWEKLGGRRLWLRDRAGNEFYYAHLSAYSPHARDGEPVRAGTVLGYVGNSGDAELTPPHLHFEIHPAALLGLGYDGAVDPTSYLRSWRQANTRRTRNLCRS
jgi:murein DD-endopeptidase MepM/ murein hydrolase activator NlpD